MADSLRNTLELESRFDWGVLDFVGVLSLLLEWFFYILSFS